jgi:hypothetical protein
MLLAKNFDTVTAPDESVSVITGSYINGAKLCTNCAECNGKLFPSSEAAWQQAFECGHIVPYVSKRHGMRFCGEAWERTYSHNVCQRVNRLRRMILKVSSPVFLAWMTMQLV